MRTISTPSRSASLRTAALAAALAWVSAFATPATADAEPFMQQGILTADGGVPGQYVGAAVAISADGNTIVVSGPNSGSGTDYVFEKPAAGWADLTSGGSLSVPFTATTDTALAVDISSEGDTIVIGNRGEGAYVYNRPVGGWTGHLGSSPVAKLSPSDGSGHGQFGNVVGLSDDQILVSAQTADLPGGFSQGALYVYARPAGGWVDATETARLSSSDGGSNERLGFSAAIDGDTIVASASHGTAGKVYVFVRPSGGWTTATETAQLAGVGGHVAIDGPTVVVGSDTANVGTTSSQGFVSVFERPTGGWTDATTPAARLTASDPHHFDYLGRDVAIAGDTIVAGAGEVNASEQRGAVYVFDRPAIGWTDATQTERLTASDAAKQDDFGKSVAIGGRTIVAGAPFASAQSPGDSVGKAYVFSQPAPPAPEPTPKDPTAAPSTPPETPSAPVNLDPAPVVPPTPEPKPLPLSEPVVPAALACTRAQVVLVDVVRQGGKVLLTGAARTALAGKTVKIKFLATGKTVASGKIGSDGSFRFNVPLPAADIRDTNKARYQAVVGSHESLSLKLVRRAQWVKVIKKGDRIYLAGRVFGSFKAGAKVTFSVRVTCGAFRTVAVEHLSPAGRFEATVDAPEVGDREIAVYRAATTVLLNGVRQITFTLPLPPK